MHFRLRDFIFYPIRIKHFHDMLKDSQYWKEEQRRAWVQEHLDRILRHAVKYVPYYKKTLAPYENKFNDMIDHLDLSELPFLTKDIVKNHFEELVAENCRQYRPVPAHTSGSTGSPTKFLLDRQSNIMHFASIWRILNWADYRFGQRFASLTGHAPLNNHLFEYDFSLNCLHLSSGQLKKEHIPLFVEKLKKFNPVLIKTYPSAIDLFGRWMHELGLSYNPKVVLTCAENLLEHQKATIENIFKSTVFDFYNQNERAGLISTCEKGNYHIHEEYSFIELTNESNHLSEMKNIKPIVATTFHNYAMPLIRYQTDDLAIVDGEASCECRRTYRMIKNIIGRIYDIVVTPEGGHVAIPDGVAFETAYGIRQSQIVQDTNEEICVKIVKANSFSQKDIDLVEEGLRERLGNLIKIKYEFVDTIAPGRNGKLQFVVSKPGKEALTKLHNGKENNNILKN